MSKPRKKKRTPKRVLALPDLEQSNVKKRSANLRPRHNRLRGLVQLRAAPRIQSHSRPAIPNPSRTRAVRSDNN